MQTKKSHVQLSSKPESKCAPYPKDQQKQAGGERVSSVPEHLPGMQEPQEGSSAPHTAGQQTNKHTNIVQTITQMQLLHLK